MGQASHIPPADSVAARQPCAADARCSAKLAGLQKIWEMQQSGSDSGSRIEALLGLLSRLLTSGGRMV